jgi:hypothetical protein
MIPAGRLPKIHRPPRRPRPKRGATAMRRRPVARFRVKLRVVQPSHADYFAFDAFAVVRGEFLRQGRAWTLGWMVSPPNERRIRWAERAVLRALRYVDWRIPGRWRAKGPRHRG